MRAAAALAAAALAAGGGAAQAGGAGAGAPAVIPAPEAAARLAVEPSEIAGVMARLAGQRAEVAPDRRSVRVDDVAGLGRPWVGTVERRGEALWLVTGAGALRLTGPLARPRIAGPGYAVWVAGAARAGALAARRLGVLRRPR